MRVLTVLGVMATGLAIGTGAVLAPLALKSGPSDWFSGSQIKPLDTRETIVGTGADVAPVAQVADAKLARLSAAAKAATEKLADARVVDQPWITQVTAASDTPRKLTSSKPGNEDQKRDLVREIQRELKRVGCYDGDADGQWGGASKRGMADFTQRVNASLPFEEPDFILLTLIQGHKGSACSSCPTGQKLNENTGRCVAPAATVAQAQPVKPVAKQDVVKRDVVATHDTSATVGSAWSATTLRAPRETGSVAAATPSPTVVPSLPPPAARTETLVVARPAPAIAALAPPEPVLRPAAAPLPGRMTVGGPASLDARPSQPTLIDKPRPARLAATDPVEPPRETKPVTEAEPSAEPPRRAVAAPVVRVKPSPSAPREREATPAPKPKRPEPVVVHRPSPPPVAAPPKIYSAPAEGGSKSRRLVYELFQRPDRN